MLPNKRLQLATLQFYCRRWLLRYDSRGQLAGPQLKRKVVRTSTGSTM